ncbi:hypothetical protein [Roseobacter denitrificans]|uniref:hypothetical protein n=1 Tax=Roseobacter denitrificans TaxID=2434 RepID=UPI001160A460|nr:hypothetical protein [Roseobacter denitrificans]
MALISGQDRGLLTALISNTANTRYQRSIQNVPEKILTISTMPLTSVHAAPLLQAAIKGGP